MPGTYAIEIVLTATPVGHDPRRQPAALLVIRISLYPGDLNKAVKRDSYPTTAVEKIAAKITDAKRFAVLDVKSEYLQQKL